MESFARVAEAGVSSPRFTALCSSLVSELRALCPLEEDVSPTRGPEDAEMFQIEVSGLLGELRCPYSSLTTGDVTSRLRTPDSCLQLLYFLSSELLAARLQARKKSPSSEKGCTAEALHELQHICQALGMPEPDPGYPIRQLMADIESKISEVLSTLPPERQQMPPLLKVPLTYETWKALEGIQEALGAEYECRRRMMLTRFDVTVDSFHWSERSKLHSTAMTEAFKPLRQALQGSESQVSIAHLLAAREDFSRITKTSSGTSRAKTSCAVNKVLMGSVPDRGGRPNEIERPMPTWDKRREGGGGDRQQRWGKRGKKKKK